MKYNNKNKNLVVEAMKYEWKKCPNAVTVVKIVL